MKEIQQDDSFLRQKECPVCGENIFASVNCDEIKDGGAGWHLEMRYELEHIKELRRKLQGG